VLTWGVGTGHRYASGNELTYGDLLIQDFYAVQMRAQPISKELPHPMHLTVDTALEGDRMAIRAYAGATVGPAASASAAAAAAASGIPGAAAAAEVPQGGFMFVPVPCAVKVADGERVGMEALSRATDGPAPLLSELGALEQSIVKLQTLLASVQAYVADVVAGRRTASAATGRYLLDAVAAVPKMDPAKLEHVVNANVHDLLMVVYLATLTRTQLALADRLQHVV
jgi:translation initiation factor 3 subunit F